MAFNSSQLDLVNIDKEIRILKDKILSLHSTRNTLIPISQLPAEVLESIFDVARCQGTHTIHLTWVSRAWRDLVLGCKTLWTLINPSNSRWGRLYLERSSPMPLVVDFHLINNQHLFSWILVGQLHRIRAFVMLVDNRDFSPMPIIQDAFLQHGTSPLPHTELMRLTQGDITRDILLALWNTHHLSFRSCQNLWLMRPPVSFPFLQSLCVSHGAVKMSVHDLLGHLESMPALRILILEGVFESHSHGNSTMTRRPSAGGPKLATLTISEGAFGSFLPFLQNTSCITRETDVSLNIMLCHLPLDRIRNVLRDFNQWATSPGRHTEGVTHLALDAYKGEGEFLVIEYGSTEDNSGYSHLRASVGPHLSSGLGVVPILSQTLPLQNLQVLWVHSHDITSEKPQSWQPIIDAFGPLPRIQHLAVGVLFGLYDESLLSALRWAIEDTPRLSGTPAHHPHFSSLKTLSFPSASHSMVILHALLKARQRCGLKLETLSLPGRRAIEELRKQISTRMIPIGSFGGCQTVWISRWTFLAC
ncbi:hypothetical protein BDN72DRAFT_436123 [Pluteus cervinus]|uniref:Uncharacterized protein n=1 Tax=Pluteus cervinus TaxID=181527 RepID=A0ACD3B2J2_9AGAR|nr:hypothetical protein BDN72DRAFT_436123 [Pluteus cervinus]